MTDHITSQTTRVVLVEDNTAYREVIEIALAKANDIELVGTFGAAEVALRSIQRGGPSAKPDVILLDLSLPGIQGLEAIPPLVANAADSKIIVLTQSNHEADVLQAVSLGASGYLLKTATVAQIIDGIRGVMAGDAPLDARIAKYILATVKTVLPRNGHPEVLLTKREMEVLELLAEGLTKREIADRLNVSNSTISTHAVHLFEKLRVQNAPSAVAKAFRLGLFPTR
ncbi:MAG: response regulator transcription factor [Planctomycetota bacterium]